MTATPVFPSTSEEVNVAPVSIWRFEKSNCASVAPKIVSRKLLVDDSTGYCWMTTPSARPIHGCWRNRFMSLIVRVCLARSWDSDDEACLVSPGPLTTKTVSDPKEATWERMNRSAPFPTASMRMTDETPMTMPSMVRADRPLLRRRPS